MTNTNKLTSFQKQVLDVLRADTTGEWLTAVDIAACIWRADPRGTAFSCNTLVEKGYLERGPFVNARGNQTPKAQRSTWRYRRHDNTEQTVIAPKRLQRGDVIVEIDGVVIPRPVKVFDIVEKGPLSVHFIAHEDSVHHYSPDRYIGNDSTVTVKS